MRTGEAEQECCRRFADYVPIYSKRPSPPPPAPPAKTALQLAKEMLAQCGHTRTTPPPAVSSKSELWEQYRALPIAQQRAFYVANREAMS